MQRIDLATTIIGIQSKMVNKMEKCIICGEEVWEVEELKGVFTTEIWKDANNRLAKDGHWHRVKKVIKMSKWVDFVEINVEGKRMIDQLILADRMLKGR